MLIVCTPRYKGRADNRTGGVGYEGDIISGEVLSTGNQRKFIPILRVGEPHQALPTSLAGKLRIDLRGDPYKEEQYEDLLNTLMDTRPRPPAVGVKGMAIQPDAKIIVAGALGSYFAVLRYNSDGTAIQLRRSSAGRRRTSGFGWSARR